MKKEDLDKILREKYSQMLEKIPEGEMANLHFTLISAATEVSETLLDSINPYLIPEETKYAIAHISEIALLSAMGPKMINFQYLDLSEKFIEAEELRQRLGSLVLHLYFWCIDENIIEACE